MPAPTTLQFTSIARDVSGAARALRLRPPTFRSPPTTDAVRSVRRWGNGGVTVAVRYKGRSPAAVLADCIEGVVVANRLQGPEAVRARTALWEHLREHPAAQSAVAA